MVTVSVTLPREDGSSLGLLVECAVSGRYRPARLAADPDDSYEAECPEVEVVSAQLEDGTDAEGNSYPYDVPTEFNLNQLSDNERRLLDDLVYERAARYDEEPDYEPDPDDYEPFEDY